MRLSNSISTTCRTFEFTVEDDKLFILQTRNGKRTGFAAVRIAVAMVKEKLISKEDAVKRVPA